MLLAFTAPEALDVARVGGKGFGLARATQAGLLLRLTPIVPMMYPQISTASVAPTECEVFHIDIFVANSLG